MTEREPHGHRTAPRPPDRERKDETAPRLLRSPLQIAYKLHLGAQKELEDAVHLYMLFEESLSIARLEKWVTRLGVEDEYDRLKRA